MGEVFRASRLKDALSPDEVVFGEKGVTFRVNKVVGSNENFVLYSDISGVEVENGAFFSTIRILPRMRPEIVIRNFTRGDAKKIKDLILERL